MGLGLAWTAPVEVFALRLTYTRYAPLCVCSVNSASVRTFKLSFGFSFLVNFNSPMTRFPYKTNSTRSSSRVCIIQRSVIRIRPFSAFRTNFAPRLRICNPLWWWTRAHQDGRSFGQSCRDGENFWPACHQTKGWNHRRTHAAVAFSRRFCFVHFHRNKFSLAVLSVNESLSTEWAKKVLPPPAVAPPPMASNRIISSLPFLNDNDSITESTYFMRYRVAVSSHTCSVCTGTKYVHSNNRPSKQWTAMYGGLGSRLSKDF